MYLSILTLQEQRKNWEAEGPSADQKSLASEDGDEPPFGGIFKRKNPKNVAKLDRWTIKTKNYGVVGQYIADFFFDRMIR